MFVTNSSNIQPLYRASACNKAMHSLAVGILSACLSVCQTCAL